MKLIVVCPNCDEYINVETRAEVSEDVCTECGQKFRVKDAEVVEIVLLDNFDKYKKE